MPVFTELYQRLQVASLPDGSLISWLAVPGDPSSESCAFVRRGRYVNQSEQVRETVWLAPGNGWEPEDLDVLEFPVKVILLGTSIAAGDCIPLPPLQAFDGQEGWIEGNTLNITGGTYPRDVALQCASTIWADARNVEPKQVIAMAERFAEWLTPIADRAHDQTAYFSGGPTDD